MKVLKYIDKWLLVVTILLFVIGTIMIFSASNVSFYMRYESSPYKYLIRQIIILGSGIVLALFVFCFKSEYSSKIASWLNYGVIISLFLLFIFGRVTNAAQSWFALGKFSFQPSEILKATSILFIANYYESKKKKLDSYVKALYPLSLSVVAFILVALQPDLGTAVIFASIVAFMFFLSPVNKKIKKSILGIGVGFIAIVGLVLVVGGKNLLSERQMSRITSVIESSGPCDEENYYTTGNQVCNGYIAINNGGLTGRGLGNSIQKYLYLPEAHTDFIFCIIIEELGLLVGLFILLLFMVVITRIIMIGRRCLNNRDALICYGGAFYIFIHIMVNLFGIFGILPMTGVPLPFMSYGGTYTWCLIAILAVIQRINVETKVKLAHNVGKAKSKA